ncbi:hypothetical protein LX32DRAFT_13278 [Colletotrichum zoysiae]|uniref:Uncharacterized protein n=1 Tax=Colletotrichum zoysiae TaxID=1216348 RepID=A0AAD9M2B1_9PEZI|nr:hypothetical protein LX32DRAFT_13278 [Colletotrichum zoysiae]
MTPSAASIISLSCVAPPSLRLSVSLSLSHTHTHTHSLPFVNLSGTTNCFRYTPAGHGNVPCPSFVCIVLSFRFVSSAFFLFFFAFLPSSPVLGQKRQASRGERDG